MDAFDQVLNEKELALFDLKPEYNEITFFLIKEKQSNGQILERVKTFKTNGSVVSDVDGTITKSDVLGQLLGFKNTSPNFLAFTTKTSRLSMFRLDLCVSQTQSEISQHEIKLPKIKLMIYLIYKSITY